MSVPEGDINVAVYAELYVSPPIEKLVEKVVGVMMPCKVPNATSCAVVKRVSPLEL